MASQHTAQVVGTEFANLYYTVFNDYSDKLYCFYNHTVSDANPVGVMLQATPTILSYGHAQKAETKTIDAHDSLDNELVVFVRGSLSGSDGVKRGFSHMFFLAPQENGYFVRNDIFKFEDSDCDYHHHHSHSGLVVSRNRKELYIQDQDDQHTKEQEENLQKVDDEHVEKQEEKVLLKELREASKTAASVSSHNYNGSSQNVEASLVPVMELAEPIAPVTEAETSTTSTVQRDAPRKSYASIVKLLPENPSPFVVPPPSMLPPSAKLPSPLKLPPAQLPAPTPHQEVECLSIIVKNLPYDTTPKQLEELFKRFGQVKPHGIYIKNNHQLGTCFAFVDFETHSSIDSAIKASPLRVNGRPVYIEKKLSRGLAVMSPGTNGKESLVRGDARRGVSSDNKVAPAAIVNEVKLSPPSNILPSTELPAPSKKQPEVEDHSIFVRNLPFLATPTQLEKEFKRIGPVKPRGIYIRRNHSLGTCFAFVEFVARRSVEDAIKASPLRIEGRPIYIEEKLQQNMQRNNENKSFQGCGSSKGSMPENKVDKKVDYPSKVNSKAKHSGSNGANKGGNSM